MAAKARRAQPPHRPPPRPKHSLNSAATTAGDGTYGKCSRRLRPFSGSKLAPRESRTLRSHDLKIGPRALKKDRCASRIVPNA